MYRSPVLRDRLLGPSRWLAPAVVLICAAWIAGCGFRPLYAPVESSAAKELALVEVAPIADRIGQQLQNQLFDLLNPGGRPVGPRYILHVDLRGSSEGLSVAKSEIATRANYRLTASYSLVDTADGRTVTSGKKLAISSFNYLQSDFATLISEKDARNRAIQQMAEEIQTGLAAFFAGRGGEGTRGMN